MRHSSLARLTLLVGLAAAIGACRGRAPLASHILPRLLPEVGDVYSGRIRVRGTFAGEPLTELRALLTLWVAEESGDSVTLRIRVSAVGPEDGARVLDILDVELDAEGNLGPLRSSTCGTDEDRALAARLVASLLGTGPAYEGRAPSAVGTITTELDGAGAEAVFASRAGATGLEIRGRGERLLVARDLSGTTYDGRVRLLSRQRRATDAILPRRTEVRLRGEVDARVGSEVRHGRLELESDHEIRLADEAEELPELCEAPPMSIPVTGDDAEIVLESEREPSPACTEPAGGFRVDMIAEAIRERITALYACRSAGGDGGNRGRFSFTIETTGEVRDVSTLSGTTVSEDVSSCAARVLGAMRFPAPPTCGAVIYAFPLDFGDEPRDVPDGFPGAFAGWSSLSRDLAMGCYDTMLFEHPELAGRVSVRATIHPDGSVTDVALAENRTGNVELAECAVRLVSAFRFEGGPEGAPVTETLRFDLDPRRRPRLLDAAVARTSGPLEPERVARLLHEQRVALRACFRVTPGSADGIVSLALTVDGNGEIGEVREIEVHPSHGLRRSLEDGAGCVMALLDAQRIPPTAAASPDATSPSGASSAFSVTIGFSGPAIADPGIPEPPPAPTIRSYEAF